MPEKEIMPIGVESFEEALFALEGILKKKPEIERLIRETSIPYVEKRLRRVWSCSQCETGRLHGVGTNKIGDKPVSGGLSICDKCGHHERRR